LPGQILAEATLSDSEGENLAATGGMIKVKNSYSIKKEAPREMQFCTANDRRTLECRSISYKYRLYF